MEQLEKLFRVRAARLGEQHLAAEPREKRGELVGVALLVEEIRAEHEIPRRVTKERLRLAPAHSRDTKGRMVPLGVLAQELDRILRPVRRENLGAAQRRGECGQPETAPELEYPTTGERKPGDVPRKGEPARPELGPVREELLLVERRLVDQVVGARRTEDLEPEPVPELDLLLDEVQRVANRSTGLPSGSRSCA